MITEEIIVNNVKCNGCANTIRREVAALNGVTEVEVDIENASVTVDFDESIQKKENIIRLLCELGYPEQV